MKYRFIIFDSSSDKNEKKLNIHSIIDKFNLWSSKCKNNNDLKDDFLSLAKLCKNQKFFFKIISSETYNRTLVKINGKIIYPKFISKTYQSD